MRPEGKRLFLQGCDISQYYHGLKAPSFLVSLVGLPRVMASLFTTDLVCETVVPFLLCVPMGASFAVLLSQTGRISNLNREGLPVPVLFVNSISCELSKSGIRLPYIYDKNSIGTNQRTVNRATGCIRSYLARNNLPVEDGKSFEPMDQNQWWNQPDVVATRIHHNQNHPPSSA